MRLCIFLMTPLFLISAMAIAAGEESAHDCRFLLQFESAASLPLEALSNLHSRYEAGRQSIALKRSIEVNSDTVRQNLQVQINDLEREIEDLKKKIVTLTIGAAPKAKKKNEITLEAADKNEFTLPLMIFEEIENQALDAQYLKAQEIFHHELARQKAEALRNVLGYLVLNEMNSRVILKPVKGGVAFTIPKSVFNMILSYLITNRHAAAVQLFSSMQDTGSPKSKELRPLLPAKFTDEKQVASIPREVPPELSIEKTYSPYLITDRHTATERDLNYVADEILKDQGSLMQNEDYLSIQKPSDLAPMSPPPNAHFISDTRGSYFELEFVGWKLWYDYGPIEPWTEERVVCPNCVHERDRYRTIHHEEPKYLVLRHEASPSQVVQIESQKYFTYLLHMRKRIHSTGDSYRYERFKEELADFFLDLLRKNGAYKNSQAEVSRLKAKIQRDYSDLVQMALGYSIEGQSSEKIILKNKTTEAQISIPAESFSKVRDLLLRKRAYLANQEFENLLNDYEARSIQKELGCTVLGESGSKVIIQVAGRKQRISVSKEKFSKVLAGLFTHNQDLAKKLFREILKESEK